MRTKEGFMLRQLGNQYVVVALGKASEEFHGIIRLNQTGAFLWEKLSEKDTSEEALTEAMMSAYEIDAETARKDVEEFLQALEQAELLRE